MSKQKELALNRNTQSEKHFTSQIHISDSDSLKTVLFLHNHITLNGDVSQNALYMYYQTLL